MSEETIDGEALWNAIYEIGRGIMLDCHLEPENPQDDPRRRLSGRIYAVVRNKGIPISIPPDVLKIFEPAIAATMNPVETSRGIIGVAASIPKVVFDTTIGRGASAVKSTLGKLFHVTKTLPTREEIENIAKEEG